MQQMILLQILLLGQHVSGTIMPIIRSSRVLYQWLLPVVFGALVFKLSVCCGAESFVSGLPAAAAARKPDTHTHTHTHIYIYIYILVVEIGVCVFACVGYICN